MMLEPLHLSLHTIQVCLSRSFRHVDLQSLKLCVITATYMSKRRDFVMSLLSPHDLIKDNPQVSGTAFLIFLPASGLASLLLRLFTDHEVLHI
jgi:hypothetical protein